MVFGDGVMTKDECVQYANESGLAQLAADNGSNIIFIQPVGDTWTDADADVYVNVASMMSDSSTDVFVGGVADSVNFMTQAVEKKICGSQQRIYVYGIGSGADMVANHWLKTIAAPTFWGGMLDSTMASATLEDLSDVSGLADNDIPTVSIGNGDEINAALKAANTNGLFMTADDRDYVSQAAEISAAYRRQSGVLIAIPDYASEGIVEKIEAVTVPTSSDNTFTTDADTVINYVTYYAKDLDVASETKKVPLVVTFHGGGNTALYQAMALEWPEIAKANDLIVVSVDLHYPNHTATEIVELISELEKEYPGIDTTRIYATGFSMGSVKTWDLYEQYPEVFAGLAPMHGSFGAASGANTDTLVPVFFIAGEASPLPELPNDVKDEATGAVGNNINLRVADLLKVNAVSDNYVYDGSINKWGFAADLSYTVTDTKVFTNSVLTVNLYKSGDGNYYTALASSSNQSHELFARNAWAAWDFLKQFSRNADGTITISTADYTLASDDGTVADNSYNASGITAVSDDSKAAEVTDIPKTGESILLVVIALCGMAFMLFLARNSKKEYR
jgi:poly(3-hydroxybutyrate) depolymerase